MFSNTKRPENVAMLADAEGAEHHFIRKRMPRNYRPAAIRSPTLLLFLSVLAAYISMIEFVLHRSSNHQSSINGSSPTKRNLLVERANLCADLPNLNSALASLDNVQNDMCAQYSATYKTLQSVSPPQSTAFQQWAGAFDQVAVSLSQATRNLESATQDCARQQITNAPGLDPNPDPSVLIRLGCASTTLERGCYGGGKYSLAGSTITSSASMWCAAVTSNMLSLTTQTSKSTTGVSSTSTGSAYLSLTYQTSVSGLLSLTTQEPTTTANIVPTTSLLTLTSTAPKAATSDGELSLTTQTPTPVPIPLVNPNNADKSTTIANAFPTSSLLTLTSESADMPSFTRISDDLLSLTTIASTPGSADKLLTITSVAPTKPSGLPTISPSATNPNGLLTLTSSATNPNGLLTLTSTATNPNGLLTLTSRSTDIAGLLISTSHGESRQSSSEVSYIPSVTSSARILSLTSEDPDSPKSMNIQTMTTDEPLPTSDISVYTYTAEYTTMMATTDSEGHSTTSPVVLLVPTVGNSKSLWTVTTAYTTMVGTTDSNGRSTSISVVIVHNTVLTTSPAPSTAVLPASTGTPGPSSTTSAAKFATPKANEVIFDRGVDNYSYVGAVYLPPILAVVVKSFWEIIFSNFKMMEPFHRMSKPGGASAEEAFSAQYLSNSISVDAIKSCFSGSILPLITTMVYIVVTMLASIAASSMSIRATAMCEVSPGNYMRCNPIWVTNLTVIRTVEGLLLICAILTLSLIFATRKYKTGVPTNPSTIASIASLMNDESVLHDFRLADPNAETDDLVAAIQHRRYKLEYNENMQGQFNYGISRSRTSTHPDRQLDGSYLPSPAPRKWLSGYSAVSNPQSVRSRKLRSCNFFSHKTEAHLLDTCQLVSSMGLFAVATAYFFDSKSDPLNDFFNSGTFWARFVMVGIASIVDTQWKRLEREVRISEPYRRMAKGFARPETTVLMPLNGTCWSGLPSSVYNALRYRSMWFQSLVSTTAALSDLNIIAAASLVWSDAQTIPALRISGFAVMSITGLMMIVMLLTIFWWRRSVIGQIPRCPDTVAAVVSYLCASRLTRELANAQLERVSREERDEMLVATGWRFSFRKGLALDHQERWFVDFEVPTKMNYDVNDVQTGYR